MNAALPEAVIYRRGQGGVTSQKAPTHLFIGHSVELPKATLLI